MVRRWSSINTFNLFYKLSKIKLFKKITKKRIFKLTVSTRKFYKKYSRFRRKAFNRLRHKNNWTIYSNVFKFWSHDYLNSKNFYRKYWSLYSYKINFIAFNWNSLVNTNVDLFFNTTFCLSSFNRFFNFKSLIEFDSLLIDYNIKNANSSTASVESIDLLIDEQQTNLYTYDLQFYQKTELDFSQLPSFKNSLLINEIQNINVLNFYRILIYLNF